MFHRKFFLGLATAAVLALSANAAELGVSAPGTASPVPGSDSVKPTLRVQLVITRFEGDKKVGSLPYSFILTQDPSANMTRIRMGVDAPVYKPAAGGGSTLDYQNVGTNIDCFNVRELSGGRYQFGVSVQNTAALPGVDVTKAGPAQSPPMVRRFESNFAVVLRDGQSMQTIASTDPVSGEVVKIDVTLSVVK
jgi:hypothetical protein